MCIVAIYSRASCPCTTGEKEFEKGKNCVLIGTDTGGGHGG